MTGPTGLGRVGDVTADAAPGTGRPVRRVLGIETSCDETAAAVVEDGTTIVSSVVSSQVDLHARYGGVVPELAGRAHVELLTPVIEDALAQAGSDAAGTGIDGIAVTCGPGLIGSLLVGVAEAKARSMAWDVPFVGVNHLEAHLFASLLEQPDLGWPLVVLLVSGGHTMLIEVTAPGTYRIMGATIDDAAGEAFDKVARFIGLGYPGGPAVDRIAGEGDAAAYPFPRSLPGDAYDFSFSGLKTSVVNRVRKEPEAATADVAASFQEAVVDVLVARARQAAADDEHVVDVAVGGRGGGGGVGLRSGHVPMLRVPSRWRATRPALRLPGGCRVAFRVPPCSGPAVPGAGVGLLADVLVRKGPW